MIRMFLSQYRHGGGASPAVWLGGAASPVDAASARRSGSASVPRGRRRRGGPGGLELARPSGCGIALRLDPAGPHE